MESIPAPKAWLPKINPALAPRFHELLEQGSVPTSIDSAERLARAILEDSLQNRITDIHLEPFSQGWRLRVRVDGLMHDAAQLQPEAGQKFVRYFRTRANLDPVVCFLPQDASLRFEIQGRQLEMRLATAPCFGGEKLALRLLDPTRLLHSIRELGMAPIDAKRFEKWLGQVTGMCLVTGPTGSGKTTTLYALLHELELSNHTVITIEDPIEYPIDGIAQIQVDTPHGLSLAAGLRAMLRLDPDYLLVGEIRDLESARVTVEAAASGHFVMSTLHCPDAAGVVTILRSWNIPDHQIATVLQIVVNQRLVRRLCVKCRQPCKVSSEEKDWLDSLNLKVPAKLWRAVGCDSCRKTGYKGRVGVFEVWHRDESDYALILNNADEHALRAHLRRRGLNTVLEDGMARVGEGVTSLTEIQQMGAHVDLQPSKSDLQSILTEAKS